VEERVDQSLAKKWEVPEPVDLMEERKESENDVLTNREG